MPNVPLYSKWRRETLSFSVPKSTVLQDIGHPRSRVFCLFVCFGLLEVWGGRKYPSLATSVPSAPLDALQHFCTEEQRRQVLICGV